jgi:SAM-dependent methyltransferase
VSSSQPEGYAERLGAFGLGHEDLRAWQDTGRPEEAFGGWLTDRVARRPAGARARRVYGAEDVHDFARRAIPGALARQPGDRLLEIGCGGGLLLRDAPGTGVHAAGLGHSPDMAELAAGRAPGAAVLPATAERLPFAADSFTAAAMSVVFFFLTEPLRLLAECRRVLRPGGRLAVFTARSCAARRPEPLAAQGHFHSDAKLAALARQAGLAEVKVHNDRGGQLLTAHI